MIPLIVTKLKSNDGERPSFLGYSREASRLPYGLIHRTPGVAYFIIYA